MDKMEEWELLEFFGVIEYAEYIWWDTARFLFSSQLNMKKVGKLSDIVEFPWDKKNQQNNKDIEISNDEVNRLRKMASQFIKNIQPNNNGSTNES